MRTTTIHCEGVFTNALQSCCKELSWFLYKQVIPSQMLVVTISMQDEGCKMIRAAVSLVAL